MFFKMVVGILLMMVLAGCAKVLTTDRSGFTDANGNFFDVIVAREQDRTGTEAKHFLVVKDGNVVSNGTVSGRGIIAGMTDGTLPAAMQAGGLIGMGALMPGTNISNTNEGATGGNAEQTLSNKVSTTNINCNQTTRGWIPPGHNK